MTDSSTPGGRLRAQRRATNLSAEELGRRAALVMGRDRPISASAIRNQENGTNGLPMSVAAAYAEILKVDAQWLLFGDKDLSPNAQDRQEAQIEDSDGRALDIHDIHITSYGIVSGRWLPEMVKGDKPDELNDLWLLIPGWSGNAPLIAYEVADSSLEPIFPKGAWLIGAPQQDAVLKDGTIVLANKRGEDETFQSIRALKATKGGVDLVAVGTATNIKAEPLVRDGALVNGTWISEAIITSVRHLPEPKGPPLDLAFSFGSAVTDAMHSYVSEATLKRAADLMAEDQKKNSETAE